MSDMNTTPHCSSARIKKMMQDSGRPTVSVVDTTVCPFFLADFKPQQFAVIRKNVIASSEFSKSFYTIIERKEGWSLGLAADQ